MTTEKQTTTNRANALQSTGPRTSEGKAAVAGNALKHGAFARSILVPGEKRDDWKAHRAGIRESLMPATPLEVHLAERIAALLWRIARVSRYEAAATRVRVREALIPDSDELSSYPGKKERDAIDFPLRKRSDSEKQAQKLKGDMGRRNAVLKWLTGIEAMADDAVMENATFRDLVDAATVCDSNLDEDDNDDWNDDDELEPEEDTDVKFLEASDGSKKSIHEYFSRAAKRLKVEPAEYQKTLIEGIERAQTKDIERLDIALCQCEEFTPKARRAKALIEASNAMPFDDVAAKIVRAESSLHRQLLQTMHELERLQARREGMPLAPPLAVVVTLESADHGE